MMQNDRFFEFQIYQLFFNARTSNRQLLAIKNYADPKTYFALLLGQFSTFWSSFSLLSCCSCCLKLMKVALAAKAKEAVDHVIGRRVRKWRCVDRSL